MRFCSVTVGTPRREYELQRDETSEAFIAGGAHEEKAPAGGPRDFRWVVPLGRDRALLKFAYGPQITTRCSGISTILGTTIVFVV